MDNPWILGIVPPIIVTMVVATAAKAYQKLKHRREIQRVAQRRLPPQLRRSLTGLIGRDDDIDLIHDCLARSALVTLTGAGGVGKTRLAQEVAKRVGQEFDDDVQWIDLAPVRDPTLVVATLASALEVKEVRGETLAATVAKQLAHRHSLVVADNCEQVTSACRQLFVELLTDCRDLRILATSREPLRADGETVYQVRPLSNLGGTRPNGLSDAASVFVDRASMANHSFSVNPNNHGLVRDICERLDGIPLAIELAAARVKLLTLDEIADGLNRRFDTLPPAAPGTPAHQQSLLAAMEWTFALLNTEQQDVLLSLSSFASTFDLKTAEALCTQTLGSPISQLLHSLAALVDWSLVDVLPTHIGPSRYRLPETVRAFGHLRLAASQSADRVAQAHASVCVVRAERAEPLLTTSARPTVWADLKEAEGDFRTALDWCLENQGRRSIGMRLVGALFWYWNLGSAFTEGRRWSTRVVNGAPLARTAERAKLLYADGGFAFLQGEYSTALQPLEESVAIWRELGDARPLGFALVILAMVRISLNDLSSAQADATEAVDIFVNLGDRWGEALARNDLGNVVYAAGDAAGGLILFKQAVALWEGLGDPWGTALSLGRMAAPARDLGDHAFAWQALERAHGLRQASGDVWGQGESLRDLADAARGQGDYSRAMRLYVQSLRLNLDLGRLQMVGDCLVGMAVVLGARRDFARAGYWSGIADSLRGAGGQQLLDERQKALDVAARGDRTTTFTVERARGRRLPTAQAIEAARRIAVEDQP